ncbi:MFS transporter [Edaphobacter sp. 12200R-103]|uniref:MFS transporter n=1 Tax=Edaphobacter sp. 12200R-103 TaxID=2703788 RepID=UPI00138B6043|nr:MFS transporter [Edaphobacter sp. 12200R-103]QHS53384.1 MFS transporter [Edaphobacter sp. 12200R-103]
MAESRTSALRQWAPAMSMTLLGLLSYVDRSVLAILSPTILTSLHLSATQYGYAILVFSLCYMVANPIWGLWMDRAGLWIITLTAVAIWSFASGSHGLMLGFAGMCIARGVLGFGEGATFPAGLKTVTETLPEEKRAFGLGIAYSGSSLGAALTPLLITPVALRWGWRAAFGITALLGFLWIILWVVLRFSGWYDPAAARPSGSRETTISGESRWSRNLFAAAAAYGLGAAPLAFGLYAAPLYLTRVLHLGQASLGHVLWLPPAGWEAGYLVFGRLADRRQRHDLQQGRSRRPGDVFLLLSIAGFLILLAPAAARSSSPVFLTMLLFFLQMFVAGGFVVFALADGMAMLPKEHSAFLAGFAISAWALTTGLLMPLLGHLFDQRRYALTFWLVSCLPPLGTLLWRLLSRPPRQAKFQLSRSAGA